ncbi:hypothetical protein [Marinoscillum sp.]|uniref:hypothetical protein n=1 Tax=Marinoscillum sp. TaxID=2024838 RepID=UPI003BABDF06
MSVKKIVYKGKEIIYVDYRGESEDQMLHTATTLKELLLSENKAHLRLINISDAFATTRFTNYIRQLGKDTKHIPTKAAIVGITGAKKVLLLGYNRILGGAMRPFDDEETAKEYLIR